MKPQILLYLAVAATLLAVCEFTLTADPLLSRQHDHSTPTSHSRLAWRRVVFCVCFCSPLILLVLLVLLAAHPSNSSLRRGLSFFARHNPVTASSPRRIPMVALLPRCGLIMGIPHCAAMLSTESELEDESRARTASVPMPEFQPLESIKVSSMRSPLKEVSNSPARFGIGAASVTPGGRLRISTPMKKL